MKGKVSFCVVGTFHMSICLLLSLPPFLATNKNYHSFQFNSTLQPISFSFPHPLYLNIHHIFAVFFFFLLAILSYYTRLML